MVRTLDYQLPDVNLLGVDPIPEGAWKPVISDAEDLGVLLKVKYHATPGGTGHHHFEITGEESALVQVMPEVATLIALVLKRYIKAVELPEGQ